MAVRICVWAFVFVLLVLTPTTYCSAARALRDSSERSLISEERYESEKRSSSWSNQESGDDAVPMSAQLADKYATKYREWVRLQELVTQDYSTDPAAANPSVPCC
ncbi:hypothetical protein M758_6G151800 [Ceratodon purpureus]|uniref:Uncharacterized protein n=1 Tax=Ceratodon purpureus TaxID=3225 RepID=A0A8T0HGZ7_CERPU|nr:hypothetical protein KC19_6G157000 [Ceratodon purpureus]KAG0614108.1 hypothetical protein M758_6G151800 [Ceratodon purpureus]